LFCSGLEDHHQAIIERRHICKTAPLQMLKGRQQKWVILNLIAG
jgi:hypothetical protein